MILESEPDIEVVAEAVDGLHALDLVRYHDPDVVLMDVRMPHVYGVQATRRMVDSGCSARVLILTTYDLHESVYDALNAAPPGFSSRPRPRPPGRGVRVVAAGEAILGAGVTRRLVHRFVSTTTWWQGVTRTVWSHRP